MNQNSFSIVNYIQPLLSIFLYYIFVEMLLVFASIRRNDFFHWSHTVWVYIVRDESWYLSVSRRKTVYIAVYSRRWWSDVNCRMCIEVVLPRFLCSSFRALCARVSLRIVSWYVLSYPTYLIRFLSRTELRCRIQYNPRRKKKKKKVWGGVFDNATMNLTS